jgi:magnesium transporter
VAIDPGGGDPMSFETAARHATTRVPIAAPAQRVAQVLESLAGRRYESASHLVVCEAERFRGIVTIEALLAAPAGASVESIMDRDAPVVAPGVDQEIAAWHAVRRGESALSVADADGRFRGIVPPHRLLEVLLYEHEEDLSRAGGLLKGTLAARAASQETVERRFVHRLPWLLLGLLGALVAADIVGWFESALEVEVVLAFFIPGIVYLADAVGTQTETVVVRGLSVGVSMRRMAGRELATGLAMGASLAACAAPLVWWRWGSGDLALIVGLSLFAACSLATLIAMVLPWLFDVFGADPAFGSGPLATVAQDLLSLVIYFLVAAAVLA